MKYHIFLILILLTQLTYASSYTNYESAEINIELNSEIDLNPTGSNPKLIEATGILNLVPIEYKNQEVLDMKIYSEPEADKTRENNKIIYKWRNIHGNKITYGIEADIKTKNTLLRIRDKIKYPTSFESQYDKYTEEEVYININSDIENLADELFEGETDLFYIVHKVAEYIEKNIEYKKTIETENKNKKSSWVLQNKYGVCDELTNLFISILRSKNIPAKFISGAIYSTKDKKFENHGWAEVYFPNQGWLPFDLTYIQHGWIDVTHIKLSESIDSGISSIDYHWKSSDLDVDINKLDIDAEIKETGKKILPLLTIGIEPAKTKIGFNSYVPIKVTVENPTSFYLTPTVYLIKAPSLTTKNKQTIFLKPKDIKNVYFTVKVPKKLNENYIFRSEIEAEVSFGTTTSTFLEFSSDYTVVTEAEAEAIISKEIQKQEKQEFKTINFDCTTKESTYYENSPIEVICVIKNKEKDKKSINVCLTKDCKDVSLTELEEKIILFKTQSTDKIIVTAEDENNIKYSTINLDLIKIPNIIIKNIKPLVIDYNEEVDLKIEFETVIPAYDVIIYLKEQEILNTNLLQGKKEITTKVKGRDLINDIKLKMTYKDRLDKEYTKTDKYLVTIKNKPWYAYLFGWLL